MNFAACMKTVPTEQNKQNSSSEVSTSEKIVCPSFRVQMSDTEPQITSKRIQEDIREHGEIDIIRSQFRHPTVVRSHLTATRSASSSVISWDVVGVSGGVRLWHSTDGCWGWTRVI